MILKLIRDLWAVTTQFDNKHLNILVTPSETDIRKALAAYIPNEPGNKFYGYPSRIEFKLEHKYEDCLGDSSTTVFENNGESTET